ncbi:hypothetical protein [Nocardia sp. NBC_00511]|uniref:hypothetical protein n=1 Tax=Nocardia sp. NBC_00511 TaxID=2903591 RepID=UPI002F917127
MTELHPNVRAGFAMKRELQHRIDDLCEQTESIVARRPSPTGLVIPEVDARGRLRDLYLAPGSCGQLGNQQLTAEIMAAIIASTEDAKRKYIAEMNDLSRLPRPLADIMREWSPGVGHTWQPPSFGKTEQ